VLEQFEGLVPLLGPLALAKAFPKSTQPLHDPGPLDTPLEPWIDLVEETKTHGPEEVVVARDDVDIREHLDERGLYPFAHVPDRGHGSPEALEDRLQMGSHVLLALGRDGRGEQPDTAPAVLHQQEFRVPLRGRRIDVEDVTTVLLDQPGKLRIALEMHGNDVQEETLA
jgi:hypothetical protein